MSGRSLRAVLAVVSKPASTRTASGPSPEAVLFCLFWAVVSGRSVRFRDIPDGSAVAITKPSAPVLAGPTSLRGGPLFLGRLKSFAHAR